MALGERKRNFLSKLRDVLFTSLLTNHILQWNGTRWVNVAGAVFSGTSLPTNALVKSNASGLLVNAKSTSLIDSELILGDDGEFDASLTVKNSALQTAVLNPLLLTLHDVILARTATTTLKIGTGALPDQVILTDWLAVNRQSSTQERQVVKITTSMPVTTDATRTGRLQFFVGDYAVPEREVLRMDATGTAAEMQLIGNVTAPINSRVASAATNSLSSRVTADANDRLQIQPGIIRFGDGTSAVDTAISRGAVGQVNFTANTGFGVSINAQSTALITLNRNGSGSAILFQDNGTAPTVGRLSNITANNSLALQNSTGATTYYEFGATLFTLRNGIDLVVGTTNGTRIGTATTQKLGFWNATPVVQPAANPDTSGATLAGLETEVNELKALLRSVGLMA